MNDSLQPLSPDERASIAEFDGGLSGADAEDQAFSQGQGRGGAREYGAQDNKSGAAIDGRPTRWFSKGRRWPEKDGWKTWGFSGRRRSPKRLAKPRDYRSGGTATRSSCGCPS